MPRIGEIVIYRNRNGDEYPALITGPAEDGGVHLHQFPPPGVSADTISYQFGAARVSKHRPASGWLEKP